MAAVCQAVAAARPTEATSSPVAPPLAVTASFPVRRLAEAHHALVAHPSAVVVAAHRDGHRPYPYPSSASVAVHRRLSPAPRVQPAHPSFHRAACLVADGRPSAVAAFVACLDRQWGRLYPDRRCSSWLRKFLNHQHRVRLSSVIGLAAPLHSSLLCSRPGVVRGRGDARLLSRLILVSGRCQRLPSTIFIVI